MWPATMQLLESVASMREHQTSLGHVRRWQSGTAVPIGNIGSREHPTMQEYAGRLIASEHKRHTRKWLRAGDRALGRASAERRRPEPQGAGVDRCVSAGSGSVHCPLLLDLLGGQREARLGGPERSEQRARRVVARCRPVLEAVA